jgi:hypothetical protein
MDYDKKLETAIERGYLIGKRNVVVEASTGRRVSGSRLTDEWSRRCERERLPDLIVNPRARGGAEIRLDLCQAGMKLRKADVDALNAEFEPIAKGTSKIMAPFAEVYSNIKVDVSNVEAVVARLQEAVGRATRNRDVSELRNSPPSP